MRKPTGTLRLITLNTWKGSGRYTLRLRMIGDELLELSPDIVCLQEAVRSSDRSLDTAGVLAERLNMHHVFAPARHKKRLIEGKSTLCHSGLAVLSSMTFLKSWIDTLTEHPEDRDRTGLTVQLEREGFHLTLSNLHLTHVDDEDSHRLLQLKDFITSNSRTARNSHWFCCGDLNCEVESSRLTRLLNGSGVTAVDCAIQGNGAPPGITFPGGGHASSGRRIDHILYLQSRGMHAPAFPRSFRVFTRSNEQGIYPSDHCGVCVDILPPENMTDEHTRWK